MIKGIAHLALKVADMDRSIEFYVEKLGLEKAFTMDDEDQNPWIVYLKVAPGMFLELFYGGQGQAVSGNTGAGFMHLCLECEDVSKTVETLKRRGVTIDVEPRQGKDKNIQAWVSDPDGNAIELMQIGPDSPQAKA